MLCLSDFSHLKDKKDKVRPTVQISHLDVNCEDLVLGLPLASCRRYPFTYLGEDKHKVEQGLNPYCRFELELF